MIILAWLLIILAFFIITSPLWIFWYLQIKQKKKFHKEIARNAEIIINNERNIK